jgi:hypothetical protein
MRADKAKRTSNSLFTHHPCASRRPLRPWRPQTRQRQSQGACGRPKCSGSAHDEQTAAQETTVGQFGYYLLPRAGQQFASIISVLLLGIY